MTDNEAVLQLRLSWEEYNYLLERAKREDGTPQNAIRSLIRDEISNAEAFAKRLQARGEWAPCVFDKLKGKAK